MYGQYLEPFFFLSRSIFLEVYIRPREFTFPCACNFVSLFSFLSEIRLRKSETFDKNANATRFWASPLRSPRACILKHSNHPTTNNHFAQSDSAQNVLSGPHTQTEQRSIRSQAMSAGSRAGVSGAWVRPLLTTMESSSSPAPSFGMP